MGERRTGGKFLHLASTFEREQFFYPRVWKAFRSGLIIYPPGKSVFNVRRFLACFPEKCLEQQILTMSSEANCWLDIERGQLGEVEQVTG